MTIGHSAKLTFHKLTLINKFWFIETDKFLFILLKFNREGIAVSSPLADKIRPKTLDDVVGQKHILAEGKPLRKIIESRKIPNMIFYGSSGIGKTTVARIIAENCDMSLHKLNGTTASIADIKDVISEIGTFLKSSIFAIYSGQPMKEITQ